MANLPHQFKKGQSGNPNGRPKGTTLVPKELRTINNRLVAETMSKYLNCTAQELQDHFKDPATSALDLIILRVLVEGIRKADQAKMNAILERIIGKVPDKIDHTTDGKSVTIQFVTPGESNDSGKEG